MYNIGPSITMTGGTEVYTHKDSASYVCALTMLGAIGLTHLESQVKKVLPCTIVYLRGSRAILVMFSRELFVLLRVPTTLELA